VVSTIKKHGVSERRACWLAGISRAGYRYQCVRPDDTALADALREYSRAHPREGYRKACQYAERTLGEPVNDKRAERVWRQEGLTVLKKRRLRRRGKGISHAPVANGPNHIWAMDFLQDSSKDGRQLRFFAVTDEFTRENLCIEVNRSFKATDVKKVLSWLMIEYGHPQTIRCDNGPEFIAAAIKTWLDEKDVNTAYIEPGKPWQNGKCESFNGRFREECLNMEVFRGVLDARVLVERWRKHYNEVRPHGSLGYLSPRVFKQQWLAEHGGGSAPTPPGFTALLSNADGIKQGVRRRVLLLPASESVPALRSLPSGALSSGQT
jgi:putative transposase